MKVKVLVIAPSEAIKSLFLEASVRFPELELSVKVANLANAVPLVKNAAPHFDIIVARGETAIIIKKTVTTPVVEIPISGSDILSAITQAEQLKMPFAVMGYASMTSNAKRIKDILNLNVELFTISQFSEMEHTLRTIKNSGYRIVVCGMGAADNIARTVGLNPINVMTSAITVDETMHRASFVGKIVVEGKERTKFFLHLAKISGKKFIVYSEDYVQVFNSFEDECDTAVQICEK
ncbi:MAG: PrpR N-terminal domain-containing protein, partial [Bullifex sp.]